MQKIKIIRIMQKLCSENSNVIKYNNSEKFQGYLKILLNHIFNMLRIQRFAP